MNRTLNATKILFSYSLLDNQQNCLPFPFFSVPHQILCCSSYRPLAFCITALPIYCLYETYNFFIYSFKCMLVLLPALGLQPKHSSLPVDKYCSQLRDYACILKLLGSTKLEIMDFYFFILQSCLYIRSVIIVCDLSLVSQSSFMLCLHSNIFCCPQSSLKFHAALSL